LCVIGVGFLVHGSQKPAQDQEVIAQREIASLLQQGKFEEAEALARKAVTARPRAAPPHALLGVVLDQRGRAAEAESQYRHALRIEPKSAFALTNLGVLLVRTGKTDEAVKVFEAALQVAPDHSQATLNLGALYAARKDYVRAIPLLERARELSEAVIFSDTLALAGDSLEPGKAVLLTVEAKMANPVRINVK